MDEVYNNILGLHTHKHAQYSSSSVAAMDPAPLSLSKGLLCVCYAGTAAGGLMLALLYYTIYLICLCIWYASLHI